MNTEQKLPTHLGIIMDGNRRWAKQHLLPVIKGHQEAANHTIEPLVDRCLELGIPYLTLWAFSTENWQRSADEVTGLLDLFRHAFTKQAELLHRKGIRLKTIGDLSRFPADIQAGIAHWIALSQANHKMTVTMALNYGGRDEILRAIHLLAPGENQHLTEQEFSQKLDTAELPDVELVIRTGGAERTSGFMPWQAVYAEWYFTEVLMPDFTPAELDKALENFADRQRNFGK